MSTITMLLNFGSMSEKINSMQLSMVKLGMSPSTPAMVLSEQRMILCTLMIFLDLTKATKT